MDTSLSEQIAEDEINLAQLKQSLAIAEKRDLVPFFTDNYKQQIRDLEQRIAEAKALPV